MFTIGHWKPWCKWIRASDHWNLPIHLHYIVEHIFGTGFHTSIYHVWTDWSHYENCAIRSAPICFMIRLDPKWVPVPRRRGRLIKPHPKTNCFVLVTVRDDRRYGSIILRSQYRSSSANDGVICREAGRPLFLSTLPDTFSKRMITRMCWYQEIIMRKVCLSLGICGITYNPLR